MTRPRPSRLAALMLLGAMLQVIGCRRAPTTVAPPPPSPGAVRVAESPIAALSVSLDTVRVATSGLLSVTARVTSTDDAQVSPPELPSTDSLRVVETRTEPTRRRPDGVIEQAWTMIVEPDLPGTFELPGVRVAVRDAKSGDVSFLTTEPVPVEVTSVLDGASSPEVSELRVVTAPPPPPGSITEAIGVATGGIVLAAIVVAGLIGAGVYVLVRRTSSRSSIPSARRAMSRQRSALKDVPRADLPGVLSDAARTLRACIAERAELDAGAMMIGELMMSCPELASVGEIRETLQSIEHIAYSGASVDHERADQLLGAIDRSLDALSTFVATRFIESTEAPA